jgi:Flp pilus assembly pilin Flp
MKAWSQLRLFLLKEDSGTDIAEYCLITALIALVALGIFWHVSGGLQGMWTSINNSLVSGNSSTSGGSVSGGQ